MRLPVTHSPPARPPKPAPCAFLDDLLEAAVGLPLGAAARMLESPGSRGRHGNALQWHLGLSAHDGDARLDWEDRVELKLVSVWRAARGETWCDKLKVCDANIDPYHKLANVAFVFADRITRVVLGSARFRLEGAAASELAAAAGADPHFSRPPLFVESREHAGKAAPAYYLSSGFLRRFLPLPAPEEPTRFDAASWQRLRRGRRDPLLTVARGDGPSPCPRCGGAVHFLAADLARDGWAPARHAMPLSGLCAVREHAVVAPLPAPRGPFSATEQYAELAADAPGFRLRERVAEPEDHLH